MVTHEGVEKIRKESGRIRKEIRDRTVSYIVAALGLVAGLAWNDAVKSLIEYLSPLSQSSVWLKFLYAFAVTFAVVIVSVYLVRFLNKDENQ